jgi:hypothetical protein
MEEWSVSPKDAVKMIGVVLALVMLAITTISLLAWSIPAAFIDILFN